jgi:hypothetical protein
VRIAFSDPVKAITVRDLVRKDEKPIFTIKDFKAFEVDLLGALHDIDRDDSIITEVTVLDSLQSS